MEDGRFVPNSTTIVVVDDDDVTTQRTMTAVRRPTEAFTYRQKCLLMGKTLELGDMGSCSAGVGGGIISLGGNNSGQHHPSIFLFEESPRHGMMMGGVNIPYNDDGTTANVSISQGEDGSCCDNDTNHDDADDDGEEVLDVTETNKTKMED